MSRSAALFRHGAILFLLCFIRPDEMVHGKPTPDAFFLLRHGGNEGHGCVCECLFHRFVAPLGESYFLKTCLLAPFIHTYELEGFGSVPFRNPFWRNDRAARTKQTSKEGTVVRLFLFGWLVRDD